MTHIIELQERDYKILDDIKEFKTVLAEDVAKLYWNDPKIKNSLLCCQKRLKLLTDNRKLSRTRENTTSSYYYYKGKRPIQLRHKSLIYKLYVQIATQSDIQVVKYQTEKEFTDDKGQVLRCDLFLVIKKNEDYIPVICECNLAHIYKEKYTYFIQSESYKQYFGGNNPLIIDVTKFSRSISSIPVTTVRIDEINKLIL